jgi:hypothetical protein
MLVMMIIADSDGHAQGSISRTGYSLCSSRWIICYAKVHVELFLLNGTVVPRGLVLHLDFFPVH